ncbi:MAG: hypothetical protein LBF55_04365 [Prevotellaceae bacterium]|nr:hypothetical protein [Prevotellaceae bacterium]
MKRFLLSTLLWAMCSAGAFADGTIDINSPTNEPDSSRAWGSPALTPSLTQANAIRSAPDGVSLLSLSLADERDSILKHWERDSIPYPDTIFYELPCHRRSGGVWVSCKLPSGVRGTYTVTVALLAGGTKETMVGGTNASTLRFRAPLDSLARTLISVTLWNTASGSSQRRYAIVLSKNIGLFDVITEHLSGRLRVVNNNPATNRTGFEFRECTWWHKPDGDIWDIGEEKQLYYTAGASLSDKFSAKDSMYLVLTLLNGATLKTCPDANSASASASDDGGGNAGNAGAKSSRVAIYPNPAPSGGIVKLRQSGFADGEEEEERYVKYSLFSSQGGLVLIGGDASPLYDGQGLAMPQAPGIYHLLLEGKNGKKWATKVAVGEKRHASY